MTTNQPDAIPTHPDSETCASCVHFKRCSWLLSYDGAETSCDWTPSKYRKRKDPAP